MIEYKPKPDPKKVKRDIEALERLGRYFTRKPNVVPLTDEQRAKLKQDWDDIEERYGDKK